MVDVVLAGPFMLEPFRERLDLGAQAAFPTGMGGTPVVNLAQALLDRGLETLVVTLDPAVPDGTSVRLAGRGLEVRVGPYRKRHRARDFFAAERAAVARLMQDVGAPVVHAHWSYEYALGAEDTGMPTLVSAHDAPLRILRYDRSPYRLARTLLAGPALRRASSLTAVSPYVARHIKRYFVPAREVRIVPNGIADVWFEQDPSLAKPTGAPVTFGAVLNGWGALKNGATLLRAFSRVRETLPTARLVMLGHDHGHGGAAERWARKRHLERGVTFIGSIPHARLRSLMRRQIDVLVHPSLEEAHPMAIVEGMACGVVVIGGHRSGGVPYALGFGEAGVLVDVRSPAGLAAAMLRLGRDQRTRQRVGQQGKAYAWEHFRLTAVVERYLHVYSTMDAKAGVVRGST